MATITDPITTPLASKKIVRRMLRSVGTQRITTDVYDSVDSIAKRFVIIVVADIVLNSPYHEEPTITYKRVKLSFLDMGLKLTKKKLDEHLATGATTTIPKLKFQRLVAELVHQFQPHKRISSIALAGIHYMTERYITTALKDTTLLLQKAERETLTAKDLDAVMDDLNYREDVAGALTDMRNEEEEEEVVVPDVCAA